MRYRRAVLGLLLSIGIPAIAFAQSYGIQGLDRYFRVEWQEGTGRRGPIVAGYVYSLTGTGAERMRLMIETVDGAGQVTASEIGYVLGTVPPGNRAYFEIPVRTPGPHRVRVLSYDPAARGGP